MNASEGLHEAIQAELHGDHGGVHLVDFAVVAHFVDPADLRRHGYQVYYPPGIAPHSATGLADKMMEITHEVYSFDDP